MIMPKDFLNGDFSFKNWFKIMWENGYIRIFAIAFGITIYGLLNIRDCINLISDNFADGGTLGGILSIVGLLICPTICVVVAYKGFYQFWNDLKNGRSR